MYHRISWRFALCVVVIHIALVIAGCGPRDVEKLRERQDVENLVNILEDTDQDISLCVETANGLAEIGGGEAVDSLADVFYETESRQLKESCLDENRRPGCCLAPSGGGVDQTPEDGGPEIVRRREP